MSRYTDIVNTESEPSRGNINATHYFSEEAKKSISDLVVYNSNFTQKFDNSAPGSIPPDAEMVVFDIVYSDTESATPIPYAKCVRVEEEETLLQKLTFVGDTNKTIKFPKQNTNTTSALSGVFMIKLKDLMRFEFVNLRDYNFRISPASLPVRPSSPKVFNLTSTGDRTDAVSLVGSIQGAAFPQLVSCRVEESPFLFNGSGAVPVHHAHDYYVLKIKGASGVNRSLADIAYEAKKRAIMFLLADMGKLDYDREEFFALLKSANGNEEIILDYFGGAFYNNLEFNSDYFGFMKIGEETGQDTKSVFDLAINTEAQVPASGMKILTPKDGGGYEVVVCVRSSFIHSFQSSKANIAINGQGTVSINTADHGGYVNMVGNFDKLVNIVEGYHGSVEKAKRSGNIIAIDMKEEANHLSRLLTQIDTLLHLPGQAGFVEGLSVSLAGNHNSDQKLEIVLAEDGLYPLRIAATEHGEYAAPTKPGTPLVCNLGMVSLAIMARPRSFGYLMYTTQIIEHAKDDGKKSKSSKDASKKGGRLEEEHGDEKTNWLQFIRRFTVPPPQISLNDERTLDRQDIEAALAKLKAADGDPDKLDTNTKKIIFEYSKTRKQNVGDKFFQQDNLEKVIERVSDSLAASDYSLDVFYENFLNQIEFQTILDELIQCLSKIIGIDISAEAICELVIREFIRTAGLKNFCQQLALLGLDIVGGIAGTPDNLSFLPTGEVFSYEIPAGTQGPNSELWTSAAAKAETPIPYPAAPGSKSFLDIVQDSLTEVSRIDNDYGTFKEFQPNNMANHVADAAGEIDRFLEEIKTFIDMRQLCEKMVQAGLDLTFPFDLDRLGAFSLEDLLPKIPEPPKFSLPRFQKIGSPESSAYWEKVKNTTLSILGQQIGNMLNSLIRSLIDLCFLQEEAPLGQKSQDVPLNFEPLTAPPYDLFDKYGLPDDRERIRQFMSRVFGVLNAKQSCALMKGDATKKILFRIQKIIFGEFSEYSRVLNEIDKIRQFFISVGEIFDLDFCEVIGEASTLVDNICDETSEYNQKVIDLINQGLSEEQARAIIQSQINSNLDKLKSLASLSGRAPDDFFRDLVPQFDCSENGVYGALPPGLINAKDIILEVIYDAVIAGYYIDIKTIYNILTKKINQRLQGAGQGTLTSQGTKDARSKIFGMKDFNLTEGDFVEEAYDEEADQTTKVATGGRNNNLIPFGEITQEEAPFFELYKLLSDRVSTSAAMAGYPPPEGQTYKNIKLVHSTSPSAKNTYGGEKRITMSVPKLEAGVKSLIIKNLKGSLLNLSEKGDLTGLEQATTAEELLSIVQNQIEGTGQVSDPNNVSSALVNFLDGSVKVNFTESDINPNDKDLTYLTITDVSIGTSYNEGAIDARATDQKKISRLLERPYDVDYTSIIEELDLFGPDGDVDFNRRTVFAEFMTKSIEKNLPAPGLGEARDQVKDIFIDGYDKIIYDHFLKFNNHTLTSPAFDKRGFDKMFRKLFPDVDDCPDDRPSATLVNFENLKQYADERIGSMFCKTFFDVTKLSSQGMKNIISRGAVESLSVAYMRVEILKYVMGVLPLLPVFNLKNVMKSDIFIKNIIESIEAMGQVFPETYSILVDNCYEIERFSIRGGKGESNNIANHLHQYEIDENGNGWLLFAVHPENSQVRHVHRIQNYKVLEAQSPCYPDCKEKYGVDGVGPHEHILEEKHTLLSPQEAFVKILKEQLDIVLPTVNNYFSSRMIKFKGVKRINDAEDFFKAFVYPTYDPAVNFTGPFNYGAKEVELATFNPSTWSPDKVAYTMFYDEISEAHAAYSEAALTQAPGWHNAQKAYEQVLQEYSSYGAETKLGTEYVDGMLVSTLDLYGGEKVLEIAPQGFYHTPIEEITDGISAPFSALGANSPWEYVQQNYITSYLGSAGETFPTEPGITKNGDGFYDIYAANKMPIVSHFGLFAVEPYMFVDQKLGEEGAFTIGEGPTNQSELDTTRTETILSQLFKSISPDENPESGEAGGTGQSEPSISDFFMSPDEFVDLLMGEDKNDIEPSPTLPAQEDQDVYFQNPLTKSTYLLAQQNIFDDQGKSDINTWGHDFSRAITAYGWPDKSDFLKSKLNEYFNNLCFGMRMVFHVTDPNIVDSLTQVLVNQFGANSSALATFMLENKVFGQVERTVNFYDEQVFSSEEGAQLLDEIGSVATVAERQKKRFTIELFDTKMPIHRAYKCEIGYKQQVETGGIKKEEALGGLKIENIMDFSSANPPSIGKPMIIFKKHVLPEFNKRLFASMEYELLFKHLFDYENFLAAYTQFVLAGNREVGVARFTPQRAGSIFQVSQRVIENFLVNITNGKFTPDELANLNNFNQRTNISTTQTQGIDIGEMMASLILQTPFLILKGLVEIGDPCLSVATSVQRAVRSVVVSIIGAVKSAITIAKSTIALAEISMREAQTSIEQLNQQVSSAESNLVELGFKKTGDDYEFPTWGGDYEEMGEGDVTAWLSEEQALNAWAEAYESWKALKLERGNQQVQFTSKQNEKSAAQEFLASSGEILKKVEGFYEAADPYLLPLIVLGMLPSDAYGVGFPFPIGIGPPLTPFGLAHIIFTAAGINFDDLDESIREMIEKATADGEEEEKCNTAGTET